MRTIARLNLVLAGALAAAGLIAWTQTATHWHTVSGSGGTPPPTSSASGVTSAVWATVFELRIQQTVHPHAALAALLAASAVLAAAFGVWGLRRQAT